jgi:L-malate glycosyltransferase
VKVALLMNLLSPWSRELALRLVELGLDVVVVDFRTPRSAGYLGERAGLHRESIARLEGAGVEIRLVESRFTGLLRFVTAAGALRRTVRASGADILLTLYGGGFALISWLSRFRPFAVYLVGSDVHLAGTVVTAVSRMALPRAAAVFATGGYLAATAERKFGIRVIQLVLGVDTGRFRPGRVRTGGGSTRIVCTRGFDTIYNNEYLIQGLALLPERAGPIEVTFVSAGPLLEQVRAEAAKVLAVRPSWRIHFVGGAADDGLLHALQDADIYVSLSRSDGTSISLLEALACGLFPVLSDIPANREWVDTGAGNGLLVPLDDPPALAVALERAITDSGLRERARSHNRQLVIARADSRTNTTTLKAHLQRVTHRDPLEPHTSVGTKHQAVDV